MIASFNQFEIEMPIECVKDCSHQGQCYDDVNFWTSRLNIDIPRDKLTAELLEYGAWDKEELDALDDQELHEKIVWIAACNLKDELKE